LALDKEDPGENNAMLMAELEMFFFIKPCKLGVNPEPIIEEARKIEGGTVPAPEKDGVLMVMMENYDAKCKNFISSGKLAIGIKYTKDSMEIVEHLSSIGYVLFHHRNTIGQHLFALKDGGKVISSEDVEIGRYKNVNTTEMYLAIDIDTSVELDSSNLDSTKREWSKTTRYDAQYSPMNNLR
jgi:histone deacetylase complex regulatory component SIN3